MHLNWETFLWVCNLTVWHTAYLLQDRTKTKWCTTAETQSLQPPSQSWSILSPITQTKISILFCNNSKDPSTLSKSISTHPQPSSNVPPSTPLSSPNLNTNISFICVPRHQLAFIPCPLQNSVLGLDLSYWLCADPAKKQRCSFGFNYSCVMRGFSPLQAKKNACVWLCGHVPTVHFCVTVPVLIYLNILS